MALVDRTVPDRNTFERVKRRFGKTKNQNSLLPEIILEAFSKAKHNCGNQVNHNAVDEEYISNAVEADPSIVVRKLSARFHCAKSKF